MNEEFRLCIVVVTYNRKNDLETTLTAFHQQADSFDLLLVVDNCSTDGTDQLLQTFKSTYGAKLHIETMPENSGGAGGFSAGLAKARELGADWIWLSDDDAIPASGCLEVLRKQIAQTRDPCVYGATAIEQGDSGEQLCWPVRVKKGDRFSGPLYARPQLQDIETAEMLPFLGFVIHQALVAQVGLPNAHYFISGDDLEYSLRLHRAGVSLFLLKNAVIAHPKIPRYTVSLLGRKIACLKLAPWRRYYDVRNRLWNARQTGGVAATVSSLMIRLVASLCYEDSRIGQLKAYGQGTYEGLFRKIPGSIVK